MPDTITITKDAYDAHRALVEAARSALGHVTNEMCGHPSASTRDALAGIAQTLREALRAVETAEKGEKGEKGE